MTNEMLQELTGKIDHYAKAMLSPARYEHCVRVADLSSQLCERFGLHPRRGYLAGLAHDLCKSAREPWLRMMARKDREPFEPIEKEKPSLLHGRAAAVLLHEEFAIREDDILSAVRNHTFGHERICPLGQVVFVADKIEPGRDAVDPSFREQVLNSDLDDMSLLVIENNLSFLSSRGRMISIHTELMYRRLLEKGSMKHEIVSRG